MKKENIMRELETNLTSLYEWKSIIVTGEDIVSKTYILIICVKECHE